MSAGLVAADGVSVAVAGTVLLAPVSLDVEAGQALAVTGTNGTGKTTLLRVLAGLTRPTTGSATIAGVPADERRRVFRAAVAALIGTPPLAGSLTLREQLVLIGASWGFGVEQAEARADRLLGDVGLGQLASRFSHELSSGQTRLFYLALTLARPFDILLLDEPEQRLDPERLGLVAELLGGLVQAGTALVLATHSDALVEQIGARVLHLTEPSLDQRG